MRDPRAKNHSPETFMDMRFVKQLEDSGFIKSLYPKRSETSSLLWQRECGAGKKQAGNKQQEQSERHDCW
jgi:hypothetical protein